LYLLLRICSCTSTKDIRHLIKLSFNTPKPTRGLDALSKPPYPIPLTFLSTTHSSESSLGPALQYYHCYQMEEHWTPYS
jgi:hypothetical protein